MSQHTWPEVAHYYAYSGIMGKLNWGPNSINLPLDSPQDAALIHDRLDHIRSKQITFTPILRALKDMTEDEAREFYTTVNHEGLDWENGYMRFDWKEAKLWAAHYTRHLPSSIKMPMKSFLWLVSRGFDVFGLITSGQAIRKEAGV